jgi:hypothetical protein
LHCGRNSKKTLNSLRVLTPKLNANKNEEALKGFK